MFCAVLAWSSVRFVRFADNESAATTLAMLAECFEELGGVPKVVLADRMGCLKGGVVAKRLSRPPTMFGSRCITAFRPDLCQAADPESKGIVENLVGYAKSDLLVPHCAVRRPDECQRRRPSVVRRGQRGDALADLRVPAERLERTVAAERSAVAAARIGAGAGHAQGRQTVLRAVRIGPLLGARWP